MASNPIDRLLRQREITRTTLRHLPLLIPLGVVSEITGLSFRDIAVEVRSGRVRTWQGRPGGLRKYFRDDVLAIAGMGPATDDGRNGDAIKSVAFRSNPMPPLSTSDRPGLTPPPA